MSAKMYELRDILCEELDKIADRGELSAGELDTAQKLTSTIKNIDKICMMEEEGGYSSEGDWTANGTYGRGSSYRRSRDARGRYSRENRGGYSRNGRYSMTGEMENIESQIMSMMDSGNLTASQKTAYKQALDMMRNA